MASSDAPSSRLKHLAVELGSSAPNDNLGRSSGRLRISVTTAEFSDVLQNV